MPVTADSFEGMPSLYPEWLPELVSFNDYGDWHRYVEVIYEHYLDDFVRNPFTVGCKRFVMRRYPQVQGKDKAFWHICGQDDGQTLPGDFRRCERIRWPRAIILHRGDVTVKIWSDDHFKTGNGKLRVLIWFNDEYLVVLEPRTHYVLFVTAYPTDYGHTIRELSARYEEAKEREVQF